MPVIILPMHQEDIGAVAKLHTNQDIKLQERIKWASSTLAAYPKYKIFVARNERDKVIGFAQWAHLEDPQSIELQELDLEPKYTQNTEKLIAASLESISVYLSDSKSIIKEIKITANASNQKVLKSLESAINKLGLQVKVTDIQMGYTC